MLMFQRSVTKIKSRHLRRSPIYSLRSQRIRRYTAQRNLTVRVEETPNGEGKGRSLESGESRNISYQIFPPAQTSLLPDHYYY
ncbi:hypothetical protein VTI74DRAFT_10418 [Chaetomium olivicolor]